jgi:hypothetical protein
MDKQIYLTIANRLKNEVPDLKWIDYDWGQLNGERPAVAYPCALIDVAYTDCRNIAEGWETTDQRVNANITLKLIFQPIGDSSMAAVAESRSAALAALDLIDILHAAMQGYNGNGDCKFAALQRRRATSMSRSDKHKIYVLVYDTTFISTVG